MELTDKIYVAGHRGLLGSAIIRLLKEQGYKNIITRTSKELDLRNQKNVEEFFKQESIDVVILVAAKVGSIEDNKNFPDEFLLDNVQIEMNVISSAFKNNVPNLLFVGSSCVYSENCKQPLKEDYLFNGPLEQANEAYGIAKIAGLKLCEYYNNRYGVNYTTTILTNIYGINSQFDLKHSHVIPANILRMHNAKMNNDEYIEAWGTGNVRREFLYVDDAADAILFILNNYKSSKFINVGVGFSIPIKELLEIIKEVVGFKGEILFDTTKEDGVYLRQLDTTILNELGWKPKTELKMGIKKTYDWYINNVIKEE